MSFLGRLSSIRFPRRMDRHHADGLCVHFHATVARFRNINCCMEVKR